MGKKQKILLETIDSYVNGLYHRSTDGDSVLLYILNNLKHKLRDYQLSAIRNLLIMLKASYNSEMREVFKEFLNVNQFLFRMATGSGKTDVMAASILALYKEKSSTIFIYDKFKISFEKNF